MLLESTNDGGVPISITGVDKIEGLCGRGRWSLWVRVSQIVDAGSGKGLSMRDLGAFSYIILVLEWMSVIWH